MIKIIGGAAVACVIVSPSGCGPSQSLADGTVVRDSSGIEIVENTVTASLPVCRLGDSPSLHIGRANGPPEFQLHEVSDAVTLSDGHIAILNRGTDGIRVYDRTGEFQYAFGRAGGGPGEFKRPFWLMIGRGDTLIVADYSPWRFSFFTSRGQYVRSVVPIPVYINPPHAAMKLSDGSFVLAGECCHSRSPAFVEQQLHLVRHSPTGEMIDTIGVYPNGRWGQVGTSAMRFVTYALFESHTRLAGAGSQIVIGRATTRELQVISPSGDLIRLIRWTGPSREVTEADLESYRAKLLSAATSPADRVLAELQLDPRRPVSSQFPSLSDVKIGRDGAIWVRSYPRPTDDNIRWIAFEPSGRIRCASTIPSKFQIYEFGSDYVLGKWVDDLDVEYIQRFELTQERGAIENARPAHNLP